MKRPIIERSDGINHTALNLPAIEMEYGVVENSIQATILQITASATFLPLLNEPYSFDLLVYTNLKAKVPKKWAASDPRYIINGQEVNLLHKVDSLVTYKEADEWDL